MTELPRGTVAFLMTDIEGSTRLVRDLGPAFPALLDEHFRLLGDVVTANGGTLVSSEGDSIFAVFPSARQAVLAAIAGQRALAAHPSPAGVTMRVRMGVNAGEAVIGGRDYTGLEVHRTARIMAAGHGGQILVSAAAKALAGSPGEGIDLRDLGLHQLRDMPAPEQLFQASAPDLDTEFPALRAPSGSTSTPTNLPSPPTTFVGRTRELARALELLGSSRLVTLTGPGGTGKTRLAIEAGRASLEAYPDGVWFVALDVIRDPTLALPEIVTVLGLKEVPGRSTVAVVAEVLAETHTLLILDNLEQVIAVAADVAALLAATQHLTILATSRESLAIGGEQVYAVPPLALPAEPGRPSASSLADNDCVALFVERARAARADFALTDANAPAVAAICRRLDGLPLALELAAARVNLLSPDQILARMDHRLTLLASTRRDLTDRQRTLRGAIEWSYDLLSPAEATFFRRFGVFAGGADLDLTQAVVDPTFELGDALDLAAALVDRSLIRSDDAGDGNRLAMLETIREFALDALAADPTERIAVGRRHADAFVALAERHRNVLTDPDRDAVLDRLERELPNFRAAIDFSLGQGDVVTPLRLATASVQFLQARNHHSEGRSIFARILATPGAEQAGALTAVATLNAAELASWQAEYAASIQLARRGLELAEALGDPALIAYAHNAVGWSIQQGDPEGASGHFAQAASIGRGALDPVQLGGVLQGYGLSLIALGRFEEAEAIVDESVELSARAGDTYNQLFSLTMRGVMRIRLGKHAAGWQDHRTALRDAVGIGSILGVALTIESVGLDAVLAGDFPTAATLGAGSLRIRAEGGGGPSISSAGFALPASTAAEHLTPAEADALAAAAATLTSDELVARADAWLVEHIAATAAESATDG